MILVTKWTLEPDEDVSIETVRGAEDVSSIRDDGASSPAGLRSRTGNHSEEAAANNPRQDETDVNGDGHEGEVLIQFCGGGGAGAPLTDAIPLNLELMVKSFHLQSLTKFIVF